MHTSNCISHEMKDKPSNYIMALHDLDFHISYLCLSPSSKTPAVKDFKTSKSIYYSINFHGLQFISPDVNLAPDALHSAHRFRIYSAVKARQKPGDIHFLE